MDNKDENVLKDILTTAKDDILVPKTKDVVNTTLVETIYMIGDYLANIVGKMIFGKDSVQTRQGNGNRNVYSNISRRGTTAATVQPNIGVRSSTDLQYVVVDTQQKADKIVNELRQSIMQYGQVRVADLYEKSEKVKPIFNDYNYGWKDVNDVSYRRNADGYWFNMPTPVRLK